MKIPCSSSRSLHFSPSDGHWFGRPLVNTTVAPDRNGCASVHPDRHMGICKTEQIGKGVLDRNHEFVRLVYRESSVHSHFFGCLLFAD